MTTTSLVAAHLGEEFLAQVYRRKHRVFPGDASRVAGLLSWPALNEILACHRLEPPRLRLALDGDMIGQESYTLAQVTRRSTVWRRLVAPDLHRQLADGATLVLDAIDELHPPIRVLAEQIERTLRTATQVNMYASWTAREGFGTHWDDHDVLVVQLDGAKRWRIYGPTRIAPMHRDVQTPEPPPADPVDEFVLSAGDVLYLPRGWWHAVAASEGERSLHLTFGLQTTTGADLIGWVSETLRTSTTVRADLPQFAPQVEQAEYLRRLRELVVAELGAPDLLERFFAARDAADRGRLGLSLPHLGQAPADPGLVVRMLTPRARLTDETGGGDGELVVLAAGGQRWQFATPARPALAALLDGRPHRLGDLAAAASLPVDLVADLVAELVAHQVVSTGTAP